MNPFWQSDTGKAIKWLIVLGWPLVPVSLISEIFYLFPKTQPYLQRGMALVLYLIPVLVASIMIHRRLGRENKWRLLLAFGYMLMACIVSIFVILLIAGAHGDAL